MSTLSGIASKGEKGKQKYQSLDINNLYRGESLEPSQQKSTVQRCKYGMQSLGKVPSARRPPANLPSLKSENSGSEPAVSLVPTGGAGWGSKPGETQSSTASTSVTTNSSVTQSSTISQVQVISVSASNTVLSSQPATLTTGHEQNTATVSHVTTSDKSWSSIMAGEAGAHAPSFLAHQSPLFQQEFPKLSSGDGQNLQNAPKAGSDTQYGPGPSLRPQTEGSWIQGGGRAQTGTLTGTSGSQSLAQGPLPHHPSVEHAGGRNTLGPHPPNVAMGAGGPGLGIPNNGPPIHAPPMHLPPGATPQFRTMHPPFMYRANFPGAFSPNFQANMGHPRQRFPGGFLSEGRFVGRPMDGEEIITRPIIKEEELNHMDDIARDTSWARPDEIDYNEKIVFSDNEDSSKPDEECQSRREEKRERDRETREATENDKDRNRADRDRARDRLDRESDRDRRSEERPDKRSTDSCSRSWQSHGYTRYPPTMRPQHLPVRDRENEEEVLKEKRRLQIELVAVVTERAIQRKEEEEKRHEETKRAAAKKLQLLDERLGKNQASEKKDREDSATTVVPLPNWADKSRQGDSDRDRSRTSSEGFDDKTRSEGSDFRSASQVERQSFLRTERDGRSRLPCDERVKRDYDEKDGKSLSSHRQDRSRLDDRDRGMRSGDGPQSYAKHYSHSIPPRFLKQHAERNQAANYMRSTGSPQPSNQSAPNSNFDSLWSHSSGSFVSQSSAIQNSGGRITSRRFNSESSEQSSEKCRNDRETEDWEAHDRFKSNRERTYGKHAAPYYEIDHARRFYDRNERRDIDSERSAEDGWERENSREKDSVPREKERDRHADERGKSDISLEEEKEWRRAKERKSEEKEAIDAEDDRDKDSGRKDERQERPRIERPQRPDSRDSRASRDSRNSRDSIREDKLDSDHKPSSGGRNFVSSLDSHFKDDKKKSSERKDEREKQRETISHGKYADESLFSFPNKPRHRFNYQRHIPGPPITREKLEASERNDTKKSLIQLKRFSDGKRTNDDKDSWISQGSKERKSNELWSEAGTESDAQNSQSVKQVVEEKNKGVLIESNDIGKVQTEHTKQEIQEKNVKSEIKEEKENKSEKLDEESEKREKNGKNQRGRGRSESGRGRQGWSVPGFRSSHGNRGDRRRRESGRLSGRNRFANRDWNQVSESDISGDDVSASTESGKEDKKGESIRPSKSRTNFKKSEKDERNIEMRKSEIVESKGGYQGSTAPRFDRKNEFLGSNREGFAPSGQPSRRGRGSVRMRGGISRRLDGYGPPPSKSPFSHQEDKKIHSMEKTGESVSEEKGNVDEDKGKQKQKTGPVAINSGGQKALLSGGKGSQVPPRMQKKSEIEQRESNRSKSGRGARHLGNRQVVDQGDDAWETTSENSEEERKLDIRGSRKGYQRRAPYVRGEGQGNSGSGSRSVRSGTRSNSSTKKFSGRDGHANKTDGGGVNDRSSGGRSHNSSSCSKPDGNVSNKDELKINGSSSISNSNADKLKVGEEKDIDETRGKMKDVKEGSKMERKSGREREKERRGKLKDCSGQQQGNSMSQTNVPQPLMSQVVPAPPNVSKNFERKPNLPPRFAKQRQNHHRIQKQQSVEVNETNKINHPMNMFPLKESGVGPPSVNAWEKPLRSASPAKSTTMQMVVTSSEPLQSENSSQRNSPHIPRDAVDKALLDGSSPPVNTIIFENTNFKSTPNDVVLKNQFNSHIKSQRSDKGERKISEEPEDMLGFSIGKPDLTVSATERDVKQSDPPIIYGKSEDGSDMKLDFQFENELSQLTDDKATKGMRDLARSVQQSTMSPSTADLNYKIASVKKVWESMHTVAEHSEDGNVSTFSPNFSPDSTMDPSAYTKTVEGSVVVTDDGSEVVYNTVPQMQVNVNYTASKTDVSSTTSNVCKVKPQQQTVLNSGHSPIGQSGQSPLSHGGPISPPPYSTTQAGQFNYQQTSIGGTAAQYGGMSAIPSPPTVLYNSSTQLTPAYQTFQIDGTQVLGSQAARSQFSQFPPYGLSQGIGQTSAFSQQSMYLHHTAPPTAAPDLYQSSLSQYRIQPAAGPFGQSQLNSNPSTVLISSTANSLMSATVKPSTQPIGAIGTKGAAPFQQNPLASQPSQLFIPYDPVQLGVNQSYMPNSQIVQRGAPVQPSASSFYSNSAGAQAGFYQTPGSTLAQQTPAGPQLHQATGYSLQGFNSQSSATAVGLQSFGSQMGAQQYRTAGSVPPTTYLKSAVTPHHPSTINLAQKSSTTSSQQDVLDSVFSSAPQIPSPKPRASKQINQQQSQQSPTQPSNNKFGSYQSVTQASSQLQQSGIQQRVTQSNMNLQSVRNAGGSPRYPNPIQRPVAYQHSSTRYRPQPSRPATNVKPYFGSQEGNLKLEENNDLKTEDSTQITCDSKINDSGTQGKTGTPEDDTSED